LKYHKLLIILRYTPSPPPKKTQTKQTKNIILVTSYYSCTFRFLALPRDCSDVCGGNGVYQIFPNTSDAKGFDVWCDIGSDGNIWTVRILLQIIFMVYLNSFPLSHCYYSVYLAPVMLHFNCISCFLIILFVYVDKRSYGWCISI
jgi:hypothetical protein